MKRTWPVTLIAVAALAHAATPGDYAIVVPLTTTGDSAAWRVELPIEAYAWSQDEALRDVAVFDADGRAVAVAEWTPASTTTVGGQHARIVPLALPSTPATAGADDLRLLVERDGEGRLRLGATQAASTKASARAWLLDVGAFADGIDALHLAWTQPSEGVFARFAVDAGDDLQAWRTLRADAAIALLEQSDTRIERRTIGLDGQNARYLRLRRLDEGAALDGLTIDVERIARSTLRREAVRWLPAEALAGTVATDGFAYRLPARVPVESLRLALAGDNSASELVVSSESGARDGRPSRDPLLRFTAYRLRAGDEVLDQGDVAVPRTRRVDRLHLGSNRPLAAAPAMQVGWRPATWVFLAEGRAPYMLAAGHAVALREATSLATPLAVLRARFGNDWQPPLATPGSLRMAAGKAALEPVPAPVSWRRILLWVVLGGGAVLVAGIALALLRGQRDST